MRQALLRMSLVTAIAAFGLDEDLKHPGFDGRPRRDK